MDASETKPASQRARFWRRLSDPDQLPRRWWYPPSSRRNYALWVQGARRQSYRMEVQQAHAKFSETIRLAMLSLLGFALFCLLITVSTPDSALLVANPTIKTPFADVQVSFQSFLFLAPFFLIVITLYLHIFYGYWLDLEVDYQHLTRSRELGEPSIERLPTLFSLDHWVPRGLTACIFYWLVPFVLLVMTWKAAARVEWGVPLALCTGLVTVALVFLRIRRCPASQRWWNLPRWGVMGLIVSGMTAITLQFMSQLGGPGVVSAERSAPVVVSRWLPRSLNLFRADLQGKWLAGVNLRNASASLANFQEADLQGADLRGAHLWDAKLRGANLQYAKLRAARLGGAKLQGADLRGASLQSASLRGADLEGAHLENARLEGAYLEDAILRGADLELANLQGADLQSAKLPGAILGGANLQEAKLQLADLQGASLRVAHLERAKLPMANLQGADLQGANLQGANLQRANLYRADLYRANLAETNLQGANLAEAKLQDASLRGADLRGADLQNVQDLTEQQIQLARIDERTLLPDSLKRPVP